MKKWKKRLILMCLAGYLLGITRGYVAVWRDDDPQPWLITEMPASALPPADQAALEKGIRLPDDYPLAKALEDYCS